MKNCGFIVTCEHGGYEVPLRYKHLFQGQETVLMSHRGWDPGALELAKWISEKLNAPLFYTTISRLLIECNRSLDHQQLFSAFTQHLDDDAKTDLLGIYNHYRDDVIKKVEEVFHASEFVCHLSIHSFTPEWNGEERLTDIGILFDPDRKHEAAFCGVLINELTQSLPSNIISANMPYQGIDDGFTTFLRKKFGVNYLGIEIEVNQKFVKTANFEILRNALFKSIVNSGNTYFKE